MGPGEKGHNKGRKAPQQDGRATGTWRERTVPGKEGRNRESGRRETPGITASGRTRAIPPNSRVCPDPPEAACKPRTITLTPRPAEPPRSAGVDSDETQATNEVADASRPYRWAARDVTRRPSRRPERYEMAALLRSWGDEHEQGGDAQLEWYGGSVSQFATGPSRPAMTSGSVERRTCG